MTEIYVTKTVQGVLIPADDASADLMKKMRSGHIYRMEFVRQRNYRFLKKFYSLLRLAYDNWEPPPIYWKGRQVKTSFKEFRKQMTILAGHYDMVQKVSNPTEFELVAKSISFANMSEDDFEKLFSDMIDVLLDTVFIGQTRGDVDNLVNNILSYDG